MDSVSTNPGQPETADPFADPVVGCGFTNFAVLKIGDLAIAEAIGVYQIPYASTKAEITHFLGRDAQDEMIDESIFGPALHIIMERSTSKTMDCFFEFKTEEAVLEHFRRHWDMMTESNRFPRIGHRTVTVEVANQDQLMEKLFPRAKCVRWENGKPNIMQNEDAYSTGFTGYFTNEEMVGLVRHAEHPQRSPFSLKCPQRTYECMISTLWKFPWAATTTYTVGDRNTLFVTYMKLLDVLVGKIERASVVSLSQKLLLDYIFAGLNCRGFGERQRGLIYIRGGKVAAPIRVLGIHSYWPFDVVSKKLHIKDEEYCKKYFHLVEEGVQALGSTGLFPQFFDHAEGRLPGGIPPPIRITHFEFNNRCQGLTFDAAVRIELELLSRVLTAGYTKLNGSHPLSHTPSPRKDAFFDGTRAAGMAAQMENLKKQTAALKLRGKIDSPPQSPKGSLGPRDSELVSLNSTPITKSTVSTQLGTPQRFSEPRTTKAPMSGSPGRFSEPRTSRGTLGAGLDLSPLRYPAGRKAIPIRDPKTKAPTTPMKSRKPSLSFSETIHEESEAEKHEESGGVPQ